MGSTNECGSLRDLHLFTVIQRARYRSWILGSWLPCVRHAGFSAQFKRTSRHTKLLVLPYYAFEWITRERPNEMLETAIREVFLSQIPA